MLAFSIVITTMASFGALGGYETNDKAEKSIIPPVNLKNAHNSIIPDSEVYAKSKYKKSRTISVRAKCSCSLFTNYRMHSAQWINYCPQCHKYGTLRFTRGGGCPEGMLYCIRCDADFCSVHGKEHVYGGATYLRSA